MKVEYINSNKVHYIIETQDEMELFASMRTYTGDHLTVGNSSFKDEEEIGVFTSDDDLRQWSVPISLIKDFIRDYLKRKS